MPLTPTEIAAAHRRFAEAKDYHRQFLDKYLPQGVIGDIGCGAHGIGAFYRSPARSIISIDFDGDLVRALSDMYPGVDFRVGDAFNLALDDNSLDAYIGLGIVELDGAGGRLAVAEASRVLKPGGLLYITVPHRNLVRRLLGRPATWHGDPVASYSATNVKDLLAGFDIVLVRPSSIAFGLGPFRRLASLFRRSLDTEDETSLGYHYFWRLFRPFANSLLVIAYKR